jgi:hypothetical protein
MGNNLVKTKLKKQHYKAAESAYLHMRMSGTKINNHKKGLNSIALFRPFLASNHQNYFDSFMASFSLGTKINEAITDKISTPPTIDKDSGEEM